MMLEGAVMQAPLAASCRTCQLKSWSGVDRCSRGVLASTSSKVSDFCTVMVSMTSKSSLHHTSLSAVTLFLQNKMNSSDLVSDALSSHRYATSMVDVIWDQGHEQFCNACCSSGQNLSH